MSRDVVQRSAHLVAYALEHPWAVTEPMLATIAGILAQHVAGQSSDADSIKAALAARSNRGAGPHGSMKGGGGIALVRIFGVIAPRMNMLSEMSGGTTFETLSGHVRAAVADPDVRTIVFDVDSPGGSVAGASEFARVVRDAAAKKRVIAVAHHVMASAAYWVMSGASEIVASPSALVGSIGVYTLHDDLTGALEQLGIKREVISAGKYKAEAVGGVGLSDEARAHVQRLVSSAFGRFVSDVARGRNVSVQQVKNAYGEGRLLDGESALRAGLIDRIGTLDEVLSPRSVDTGGTLDARRQELAQLAMATHRRTLEAAARARRWH